MNKNNYFILVENSFKNISGGGDCACPATESNRNNPKIHHHPHFSQIKNPYTSPLPEGFYLGYSPYSHRGPVVMSPSAWQRWESFSNPQPLSAEIDYNLAAEALLHPSHRLPKLTRQTSETLTAWLQITNECNLNCLYCYVAQSLHRMNEKTGLRALKTIFEKAKQDGFRRVKLKYGGGEPTLRFNLIRFLHEQARKLATQMDLGVDEVLLSNGVLIRPEDAEWIAKNGIKLMISLDGIGDVHDQLRPQKNKTSSFKHVAQTIDHILLPLGIRPDISMTVTSLNASGIADLTEWVLIDRELPVSFNFYRQNNLSQSHLELALEEDAIIEGMLSAYELIEKNLPTKPFIGGLLDRVQFYAHSHTCGVGNNYLVVNSEGHLAQCHMYLNHSTNELQICNLSVDEKEECQDCQFRYLCSGGCPLETYTARGRWDAPSPNCRIYKTLIPAAFRLEGLRLMKRHGLMD